MKIITLRLLIFSVIGFILLALLKLWPKKPEILIDLSAEKNGYFVLFNLDQEDDTRYLSFPSTEKLNGGLLISGPFATREIALHLMSENAHQINNPVIIEKHHNEERS